jgi:hypothetical protein
MQPIIDKYICKASHLMSDKHRSYISIGHQFSAHSHVNHSKGEYKRGAAHSNTAESFSAMLERARMGVFHYISPKHLSRYLHEFSFRWEARVPVKKHTKSGKKKTIMKQIPIIDMVIILITRFSGICLRRTKSWGIEDLTYACPFNL